MNEETGLCVKELDIKKGEMGFEWALVGEDHVKGGDSEMALELNFLLERGEIKDEEVKVDPEEHLESLWAEEMDIVGLKMTPEMRGVVEKAFACLQKEKK